MIGTKRKVYKQSGKMMIAMQTTGSCLNGRESIIKGKCEGVMYREAVRSGGRKGGCLDGRESIVILEGEGMRY